MFRYKDGNIVNEKGKVLDVHSALDVENRQVIVWNKHNGLNQQWDIVYVDEQKPEPTKGQMSPKWGFIVERPFYIVSELKSNRHLTQLPSQRESIIKTPNGNKSQKFYFDQKTRTIKLVRNTGLSLESKGNNNLGYGGSRAIPQQQFKYEKGYLINVKTNKVFDVSGSKDVEATRVTMYNKHNGANQRWRIVYVEEFKEQHKGLIEEYGLYANRAFYIRSELPNHRLAQCQVNMNVLQQRWRNNETAQQWYFDPVMKVIRNKKWTNRVLESKNHSNGLGEMRCYTPNARWWQLFKHDDGMIVNIKNPHSMEVYQGKDVEW
jgi:hypothetical protein